MSAGIFDASSYAVKRSYAAESVVVSDVGVWWRRRVFAPELAVGVPGAPGHIDGCYLRPFPTKGRQVRPYFHPSSPENGRSPREMFLEDGDAEPRRVAGHWTAHDHGEAFADATLTLPPDFIADAHHLADVIEEKDGGDALHMIPRHRRKIRELLDEHLPGAEAWQPVDKIPRHSTGDASGLLRPTFP